MPDVCTIRCTVRKGMFEGEFVVSFKAIDENGNTHNVEAIVYDDSLELDDPSSNTGRLKAYRVGKKDKQVAVVLPQSTFENGPTMVIPEDEIVERVA